MGGATAGATTSKGLALLGIAVSRGDKPGALLLLAQKYVDLNALDEKGQTSLWTGCYEGHASIAEQFFTQRC
jgi:hypothetical protein